MISYNTRISLLWPFDTVYWIMYFFHELMMSLSKSTAVVFLLVSIAAQTKFTKYHALQVYRSIVINQAQVNGYLSNTCLVPFEIGIHIHVVSKGKYRGDMMYYNTHYMYTCTNEHSIK